MERQTRGAFVENRHIFAEKCSVAEVAHPGEDHRQPRFVGGGDDVVVADRPARLDDGGRAGLGCGEQAVGEGEECVEIGRASCRERVS
jgi:hypothetical protein